MSTLQHREIDGGFLCPECGAIRRSPLGMSRHREQCTGEREVAKWMETIEDRAGVAYASSYESNYTGHDDDWSVTWYFRHDGEAFIYGTEKTGELYRGSIAKRQIRAVIDNDDHRVFFAPMANYPIEKADSFLKNDA